MDPRYGLLTLVCIALVLAAGCTGASPSAPPVQTPAPALSPPVTPVPPASPSVIATAACPEDVCRFVPASSPASPARSLRIDPSPRRYSPVMSSTPGIGLEPVATGFNATDATFTWNASYGQFLAWNTPGYTIDQFGASASGPGRKLYWSFTDKPASVAEPVIITVTAKDPASGTFWGSSAVTLAWDGNYSVTVQDQE